MSDTPENKHNPTEFQRRFYELRQSDEVFTTCPKYFRHDITEDQVMHIATKAAELGYEMAKTDIKLEIADVAIGIGKKILLLIGTVCIGILFWAKDRNFFN